MALCVVTALSSPSPENCEGNRYKCITRPCLKLRVEFIFGFSNSLLKVRQSCIIPVSRCEEQHPAPPCGHPPPLPCNAGHLVRGAGDGRTQLQTLLQFNFTPGCPGPQPLQTELNFSIECVFGGYKRCSTPRPQWECEASSCCSTLSSVSCVSKPFQIIHPSL